MHCVLMHKNIPVIRIELETATSHIASIGEVINERHLPVGVPCIMGSADRGSLHDWWVRRAIPHTRDGMYQVMETLRISSPRKLLAGSFCLSLSDQYWIRPESTATTWEEVNFFDNEFSVDVGDALFGMKIEMRNMDINSPDITTDGNLKKRWKIIDGKRCLVKGGSNPFRQQPFNEVIASGIMERLGIPHVPYALTWNNGAPYSICEDFITADTELVPAWRIIQTQKKAGSTSAFQHFINCAEAIGIPGVVPFLDHMIVLDYIIANEDRHLNNFGAVRNAETLEWLGMAPIYDSGSSLGYDKVAPEIRAGRNVTCKPFKKHHQDQLKLVSSPEWIDFDKLSDVRELVIDTLSADGAREYIDEGRIEAIADSVEKRLRHLKQISMIHMAAQAGSTENDVEEDFAEDYSPTMGM